MRTTHYSFGEYQETSRDMGLLKRGAKEINEPSEFVDDLFCVIHLSNNATIIHCKTESLYNFYKRLNVLKFWFILPPKT